MRKFRKKPVVVEAVQYKPHGNCNEVRAFVGQGPECVCTGESDVLYTIETLEGPMHVATDDWIIKGIKGEFYPCKPDIFAETYEEVKVAIGILHDTVELAADPTWHDWKDHTHPIVDSLTDPTEPTPHKHTTTKGETTT